MSTVAQQNKCACPSSDAGSIESDHSDRGSNLWITLRAVRSGRTASPANFGTSIQANRDSISVSITGSAVTGGRRGCSIPRCHAGANRAPSSKGSEYVVRLDVSHRRTPTVRLVRRSPAIAEVQESRSHMRLMFWPTPDSIRPIRRAPRSAACPTAPPVCEQANNMLDFGRRWSPHFAWTISAS